MSITYYASKCHNKLNSKQLDIEVVHPYLCLNPHYPANLCMPAQYILDSGAFQDVKTEQRLSFANALKRQLSFERHLGQEAYAIVSYDRLVDEQKSSRGSQFKARVNDETSKQYVEETISAAEFLSNKRKELGNRHLILSCQGINTKQYLDCIYNVLDLTEPGDILGLGGFCILSKSKQYEKQFYEIITEAFPCISQRGINKVHIFGMSVFRVLIQTELYARRFGIDVSYDTSSTEFNSTLGRVFSPGEISLKTVFSKSQKYQGYHPVDLTMFNIKMIDHFWDSFNSLESPSDFLPRVDF